VEDRHVGAWRFERGVEKSVLRDDAAKQKPRSVCSGVRRGILWGRAAVRLSPSAPDQLGAAMSRGVLAQYRLPCKGGP
jgi:hypothetical protein